MNTLNKRSQTQARILWDDGDRKQISGCPLGAGEQGLMAKGSKGDGNVLYLDGGGSSMGVDICQNPSNKHWKWVNFIAYKLNLSKVSLKKIQSAHHACMIWPRFSPPPLPCLSPLPVPSGHTSLPAILHIIQVHSHLSGFALDVPTACNALPADVHMTHPLTSFRSLFRSYLPPWPALDQHRTHTPHARAHACTHTSMHAHTRSCTHTHKITPTP